jgi:hypothetical protein
MTRLWSMKNMYMKEDSWKHRCWKGYWRKVENRATIVGRKAVGSFFQASGLLILLWFSVTSLVLSDESWHARDSHPPYSPEHMEADFLVFSE